MSRKFPSQSKKNIKNKKQIKVKPTRQIAAKTSQPIRKDKDRNIIVNVNSNNKKNITKSRDKAPIPQSSGPIVISNPAPYIPQYQPSAQLADNSFGIGTHRLLEGLTTRIDDIKEEFKHQLRQNQLENQKRLAFINDLQRKQMSEASTNTDKLETRNVRLNTDKSLLSDAAVNTNLIQTSDAAVSTVNNKTLLTPLSQGLEGQKVMEARTQYKPRTSTPRPQDRFTVPPKPQLGGMYSDALNSQNVMSDINNTALSNKKSNTLNQDENKLFGISSRQPSTKFQDDMSSITFGSPNRMDNESILEDINVLNQTMDTHASTVNKSNDSTYGTPKTSMKALVEDILDLDDNIIQGLNESYSVSLIDGKNYKRTKTWDLGDQIIINKKDNKIVSGRDLVRLRTKLIKAKFKRKTPSVEI